MLYLPGYEEKRINVYTNITFAKSQLYNVDLNEYIVFQFNPVTFEWERDINWGEHSWLGDTSGGDLQFLNIGPRLIDLDLMYMADPQAPTVHYKSNFNIIGSDDLVDFQAIKNTIEKWEKLLDGSRRPSRIGIMVGPNRFEGVIKKYRFKITEFFENLSTKEGILSLEFREWIQI